MPTPVCQLLSCTTVLLRYYTIRLKMFSLFFVCFYVCVIFVKSIINLLCAKSLQLCVTLCDPMDCGPLGSSVYGILQAKSGAGCHALLLGSFLIQGWKLCLLHLLHWQKRSSPLVPPGKLKPITVSTI